MDTSERILLIASPCLHKTPAFERAVALARAKDCPLHIAALDHLEGLATSLLVDPSAMEKARRNYVDRHHQWLIDQTRPLQAMGIKVSSQVIWCDNPVAETVALVHDLSPSVVIKDVQQEGLLKRALFTTQDIHLLQGCPVPLHLVSRAENAVPRNLLVAVDLFDQETHGPQVNAELIKQGLKLGEQCNADVHLLYAYDLSSMDAAEAGFGHPSQWHTTYLASELHLQQEQAFAAMADDFGFPETNRHLITGHPGKVITALAQHRQMDMILLARVQRRGLGKWLGGTAEYCLYRMHSSLWLL